MRMHFWLVLFESGTQLNLRRSHMLLAITFCLADTNKPDFPTNILLRSYQKRQKYFVTFPNNLILVRSYTQKVMANNNCAAHLIHECMASIIFEHFFLNMILTTQLYLVNQINGS